VKQNRLPSATATELPSFGDVRRFITRLSPDAVCDGCISEKLSLIADQNATLVTRELAGTKGFERYKGVCGLCGGEKLVIRKQ
jgi:hypothetical protein